MIVPNRWNRSFSLAVAAVLGVFGGPMFARGGSITPWSGASASIHVLDQSQSDAGATAGASADVQGTLPFRTTNSWTSTDRVLQASVHATASAQATGQASGLLKMGATYESINLVSGPPLYQNPATSASASWSGDTVHLQPLGGASLPDHIVLDFALNYHTIPSYDTGRHLSDYYNPALTLTYNDTTVILNGIEQAIHPGQTAPLALDQLTAEQDNSVGWNVAAAFHLDLPIDADGVSLPFSLALSTDVANGMTYNGATGAQLTELVLSLANITLSDGTSVTDAGYGVSFASGMSWPQPSTVPEPASVVVWAGLGAAGCWVVMRRARTGQ